MKHTRRNVQKKKENKSRGENVQWGEGVKSKREQTAKQPKSKASQVHKTAKHYHDATPEIFKKEAAR